jgi:hypothetical protein
VVGLNPYDRCQMSDTLWAVIVGGLLTGGAAVGAQLLAGRMQANAARDAWNRDQGAAQIAALESVYLQILRSAHQVENAVGSWQAGTLLATQAHGFIGAGNRDLEAAGLSIILRSGLDDPIVGLITRMRDVAGRSDWSAIAGCDRGRAEPLEGEPQAQERLPDDLRDGRDALPCGLLWDHAQQHGDP